MTVEMSFVGKPARIAVIVAACSVAWTGCSSSNHDAPPDSGMQPPVDGATGGSVTGARVQTCHQVDGDVSVPFDLSQSMIRAWVPDSSAAGYHMVSGTGTGDGHLRVDGVPQGASLILQVDDDYYVTDQPAVTLTHEDNDRCTPAVVAITKSTPVNLDLSNLSITDNFASIDFYVNATDWQSLPAPTPPASTLQTSLDWNSISFTLPDTAAGDRAVIVHTVENENATETTLPTVAEGKDLDALTVSNFTLHDGVAATITGAFQPVPQTKTMSVAVDRRPVDAGYDAASTTLQIQGTLIAGAAANASDGPPLISYLFPDAPSALTDDAYGDPFPATKRLLMDMFYRRVRNLESPGSPSAEEFGLMQLGTHQRFEVTGTSVVFPTPLPPPAGIQINHKDFLTSGSAPFDGTAPVSVTWQASAGASSYDLTVMTWQNGVDDPMPIATFHTAGTSLSLPASLFHDNQFYWLLLGAVQSTNDYAHGALTMTMVPSQTATLSTGRLRLSSTCGNGVTNAGEQCDGPGMTATCNDDCTTSVCGDGIVNPAAGEQCDDGGRNGITSPTCSKDCKLVAAP
jgi:hypothetical protein